MTTQHVPEGSVIITPQEIYGEVRLLTGEVRRLVDKDQNDPIPSRVETHERESRSRHDQLAERVRALELKVVWLSGAAAAFGAVIGSLIPRIGG